VAGELGPLLPAGGRRRTLTPHPVSPRRLGIGHRLASPGTRLGPGPQPGLAASRPGHAGARVEAGLRSGVAEIHQEDRAGPIGLARLSVLDPAAPAPASAQGTPSGLAVLHFACRR
jgi:hypothetical protein